MTQSDALNILKLGHNVFLTGPAGSGKTYILNSYIQYLKEKSVNVAITASTGIAATHIGGMTIHAWSGLGIRDSLSPWDIEELEGRQYLWKRYEGVKVLIIDEVSMLHHFRFDMLDRLCRSFKRNNQPFGGIQIVLCGDFFQLPPISKSFEYDAHFVYRSKAWQEMDLKICYIEDQFRQKDNAFLKILNDIRKNNIDIDSKAQLHSRLGKDPEVGIEPTKLYTHNIDVDEINKRELLKLKSQEHTYDMSSRGSRSLVEVLKKSCLAPEKLILKKGAKVMFVKNNYDKGYVNGTLGVIENFDAFDMPIVKTANGQKISVAAESWVVEEEGKLKAEIIQLPLRLAWAITVHKSQGMSLDAAEVDLSKSFVRGMGYVALSRVRSLNGLKLVGLNDMALSVDDEILEFDEQLKDMSNESKNILNSFTAEEIKKIQEEYIKKISPTKKEKVSKLPTHKKTKLLIDNKHSLKEISKMRDMSEETILSHLEKLIEEGENLDLDYLRNSISERKFEKIAEAFEKSFNNNGDFRLAPVKYALGSQFSYTEIRLARLFLNKD
jgi:ATP-dependent DNA helicase PIF1